MEAREDDDLPITREWFRSIGVRGNDEDTEYECVISVDDRTEIMGRAGEEVTVVGYSFTDAVAYIETWTYDYLRTGGTGVDETIVLGPRTTRGEMRLLFRALGAWDNETQAEKRTRAAIPSG